MKVIADIGSNWLTIDDCFNAVDACKESGIDIVKFQYFTHEKLYGFHGKMKGELPKEWIPLIHKHCVEVGIEFMCSVFDPDDVEFLDQFVTMHKIASAEARYAPLVKKCKETKKPLLLSFGCYDPKVDIEKLHIPMACIAKYPANTHPIEQLAYFRHLVYAGKIKEFGLSDHNPSEYGYELSYRFGCSYYEFHFNPLNIESADKSHSRATFSKPDIPVIEPSRIKRRIKYCRPYPKAD